MSARNGLGKSDFDVPGRDNPGELVLPEDHADTAQPLPLEESHSRDEAYAELRQRVEGGWEPREFEAPCAELGRFDPERAGLRTVSLDAVADYMAQHRTARPWLTMADTASPEARRILVAMDAGGGHALIRHEGWVSEEGSMRRVAYLEDPAQLDLGTWASTASDRTISLIDAGAPPPGSPTQTPSQPRSPAGSNTPKSGRRSICRSIRRKGPAW